MTECDEKYALITKSKIKLSHTKMIKNDFLGQSKLYFFLYFSQELFNNIRKSHKICKNMRQKKNMWKW